jgi:phage tail-like protein
MQNDPMHPWGNYYFSLEINSQEIGPVVEVTGLKSSSQAFEIEEGGMNSRVHKRPGQSKWENIVVRYATTSSKYLVEWRNMFLSDRFDERLRRSGSVALIDNDGETRRRYHFVNAWPVAWEGPSLSSAGSELAIETLELAHDGLKITNG